MKSKNPYIPINNDWLNLHKEKPILPDLKIIDPHHHLWDLEFGKYLSDDYIQDIECSGHNVRASVYIMSSANTKIYNDPSTNEYSSLPEIKFAYNEFLKAKCNQLNKYQINSSIVGALDLRYGEKLVPVIEKSLEISNNKLKGIRMLLAAHSDKRVISGALETQIGIMLDPKFLEGAKVLERFDLSLDFWIYHTQLSELEYIAKSLPNLSIILNHIGGPVLIGPYENKQALTHREWRKSMMRLAIYPNIKVKLGGLGMQVCGAKFNTKSKPPTSDHLCDLWRPWIFETIDLFGLDRCMFESNFPVDKGSYSYGVLWNTFKKLSFDFTNNEKSKIFYENAINTYKIEI